MSRILRATIDYVAPASVPESNLVFSPGPGYGPEMDMAQRLLANEVNDPGSSLGFALATPLGFQPATILFNYTTAPVSDSLYNAPMTRFSSGVPFQQGSYVIDVIFPRGKVNLGASYIQVYTVSGGILT